MDGWGDRKGRRGRGGVERGWLTHSCYVMLFYVMYECLFVVSVM